MYNSLILEEIEKEVVAAIERLVGERFFIVKGDSMPAFVGVNSEKEESVVTVKEKSSDTDGETQAALERALEDYY